MSLDRETWEFINTFAPWFSAIGTLCAVIVSLYLALSDRRIKLNVSASHKIIQTIGLGNREDYVGISIVNVGRREVTVTGIGWKMGFFKKRHYVQLLPPNPHSSQIPIRLRDGEEVSYFIPLTGTNNWAVRTRQNLGKYPKLASYFLKLQVSTSAGKIYEQRIEASLRETLLSEQ